MKRILMAMVLCLVCTLGFGQSFSVYITSCDTTKFDQKASNRSNIDVIPDWDYIGSMLAITRYRNMMKSLESDCTTDWSATNSMRYTILVKKQDIIKTYNYKTFINKNIYFPNNTALKNYKIGWNCTKAGKICVGIGIPFATLGGILYGISCTHIKKISVFGDQKFDNCVDEIIASEVFLGIGTSLITVSIPLFCWGDHIKRMCNMAVSK